MRASSIAAFWRSRRWLDKAAGLVLAVLLVLYALGGRPAALVTVLEFAAVVLGGLVAIRYLRVWLRALLWRLRHRLLVTYIFIGVVPVLLLLVMAGIAAYLFYGQVATFLVEARLNRIQDDVAAAAHSAVHDLTLGATDPARSFRSHLPAYLANAPMEVTMGRGQPAWLRSEFRGLVDTGGPPALRVTVPAGPGVLSATLPVTAELLGRVAAGIGSVRLLRALEGDTEGTASHPVLRVGNNVYDPERGIQAGRVPPADGRFDLLVSGILTMRQYNWKTGETAPSVLVVVSSRPSQMNAKLFSTLSENPRWQLLLLGFVAVAFLLIEVLSLFVGIQLTRSMTRAVADLYEGTQKVHSGDFGWHIPVRSRDQLAALAESFNTMTSSLEALIREQKEKQRMQSELEIARDVQAQLFPKELPRMRRLEVAALCNPARTVSGDYYDFLAVDERHLALTIADIAGKGISAALLMASIQSMLRAQFTLLRARAAAEGLEAGSASHSGIHETATLAAALNRQLYQSIATGNFATFCCAFYDDASGDLTYTNAGHVPPVIVRGSRMLRLEKGGTVLGIFPQTTYEQETIRLEPGDLLVAFTDGITEPENSYGEEFGEQRLFELLRRSAHLPPAEIISTVMAAVHEWTASPEQPDDMTVLIARRT
jgi:sigma-B regulation protein RsbU (phosphoserine phosphatase)